MQEVNGLGQQEDHCVIAYLPVFVAGFICVIQDNLSPKCETLRRLKVYPLLFQKKSECTAIYR